MGKMVFFGLEDGQEAWLRQRIPEATLVCFVGKEYDLKALANAEVLSPFLYPTIDTALLDAVPNCKLVATRSTGFDHIDRGACKRRGITVCNVPSYGNTTVAEHSFALLLSIGRRLPRIYMRGLMGDFSHAQTRGIDLYGKTFGALGTGRIGQHAVRIALGFGMRVLAYDLYPSKELQQLPGVEYASLDEVSSRSDVISLYLPYNESTHHVINRERLSHAKHGAVLINTARGALVDTEALLWALQEGILWGAGLDVIEGEDLVDDETQLLAQPSEVDLLQYVRARVLFAHKHVIFTPHIAFNTVEAVRRILEVTVLNIENFFAGRPSNVVG